MSKLLKVLLSIFASVFLLVIIAVIALPFFIDPNDFKPEIEAIVKDSTGRDLSIDGELELSVFPWIGISTGKLTLSNGKGFTDKPFAEIAESNVKVKLIPLFSKEIEVSRVVLKGLVLNLSKNKKGINNWDDLTKSDQSTKQNTAIKKQQATTKESQITKASNSGAVIPLAAFAIGGISIEQAKISWDDQLQGKYTEINEFTLITDKLVFGKPIAIDLSFSVVNKDPEITESIHLSTDLIINETLNSFKLTKVDIESVTTGKEIPGGRLKVNLSTNIAINLSQQTLSIKDLNINADNLALTADINGLQIIDNPKFNGSINIAEFNLATLMTNMTMPLPEMQDSNVLSKVSMRFAFQSGKDTLTINDLFVQLDETHINGTGGITNFENPGIKFDLKIDNIDIDRYLPIESTSETSGSSQQKKSMKAVSTSAKAAVAVTTLFPVETLRAFNANGKITIEKLKVNQLNMKNLSFILKAKNGAINTQQKVKHFYQGSYSGATSINVQGKTPKITLKHKLSTVQIEPLLKDKLGEAKMTGVVNASINISARGNTEIALKSSLNGNVDFNFKNGVVKGFNLQNIIDNGKALITGGGLPTTNKSEQTVFSVIKGSAQITNGLANNKDLYAEASKLRVNGKGSANLVSEKINYSINAKLLKKVATATEPEKIKGIPIAINIGGTFNKPSYSLDIAKMLTEKHKAKINKKKDELLKKLDEKLGPGVGDLIKGFF